MGGKWSHRQNSILYIYIFPNFVKGGVGGRDKMTPPPKKKGHFLITWNRCQPHTVMAVLHGGHVGLAPPLQHQVEFILVTHSGDPLLPWPTPAGQAHLQNLPSLKKKDEKESSTPSDPWRSMECGCLNQWMAVQRQVSVHGNTASMAACTCKHVTLAY